MQYHICVCFGRVCPLKNKFQNFNPFVYCGMLLVWSSEAIVWTTYTKGQDVVELLEFQWTTWTTNKLFELQKLEVFGPI